jgi:hypothetical protein
MVDHDVSRDTACAHYPGHSVDTLFREREAGAGGITVAESRISLGSGSTAVAILVAAS